MNGKMKMFTIVALVVLGLSLGALAHAQTTGTPPPAGLASIIVIATMVLQWVGSFAAARSWGTKARKLIPMINLIISTAAQLVAAFATGLGPEPTAAVDVQYAGFFAKFGDRLLDVLVNSLIQSFVVTGAHSTVKNTKEAVDLGKTRG